MTTIGFALSGGGAKGSFQLGALGYLYQHNITPHVIVGTSVGAINAAKLAEGVGGFDELQRIWMSLRVEADMYLKDPLVASLIPRLETLLTNALLAGTFGGPLGFLLSDGLDLEDNIMDVIQLVRGAPSFYHLAPIENRMRGSDFDLEQAARACG